MTATFVPLLFALAACASTRQDDPPAPTPPIAQEDEGLRDEVEAARVQIDHARSQIDAARRQLADAHVQAELVAAQEHAGATQDAQRSLEADRERLEAAARRLADHAAALEQLTKALQARAAGETKDLLGEELLARHRLLASPDHDAARYAALRALTRIPKTPAPPTLPGTPAPHHDSLLPGQPAMPKVPAPPCDPHPHGEGPAGGVDGGVSGGVPSGDAHYKALMELHRALKRGHEAEGEGHAADAQTLFEAAKRDLLKAQSEKAAVEAHRLKALGYLKAHKAALAPKAPRHGQAGASSLLPVPHAAPMPVPEERLRANEDELRRLREEVEVLKAELTRVRAARGPI